MSDPFSGDYTRQETRVPIPNTTVKLPGPMIVPTSAKVGYRRDFTPRPESPRRDSGRFFCAHRLRMPWSLILPAALVGLGDLALPVGVAQTSDARPVVSQRLLDALPRQRRHTNLLARAQVQLENGSPETAIPLLQAVLDDPTDTFVSHNNQITGAHHAALGLLRKHRRAIRGPYQSRYEATARVLLREARAQDGAGRTQALRRLVRRFRLTRSGGLALDALATKWLDAGDADIAWRAFSQMAIDHGVPATMSSAIRRKWAAAALLAARPIPQQAVSASRSIAPLGPAPDTDWPLPLGKARLVTPGSGSPPRLQATWHTSLSTGTGGTEADSPLSTWSRTQRDDGRTSGAIALYPLVVGNDAIVRDGRGWRGVSLEDGRTSWHYKTPCGWRERHRGFTKLVPVVRSGVDRISLALAGNPRFGMLTSDGRRVYGVQLAHSLDQIPSARRTQRGSDEPGFSWPAQLVAVSIPAPSPAAANARSIPAAWTYPDLHEGADPGPRQAFPVVLGPAQPGGGLLHVLTEQGLQVELVSLDPRTGSALTRQPLAHVDASLSDVRGVDRHRSACLPTITAGLAICPTGSGVTVVVDLVDGTLLWAHDARDPDRISPPHRRFGSSLAQPLVHDPGLSNLPVADRDQLYLLPHVATRLDCLAVATGQPRWTVPRTGFDYVAAVTATTVLVIGPRVAQGLDRRTGRTKWRRRPGMITGRGARLGADQYLLPLKSGQIACLDLETGRERGLSLPPLSGALQSGTPVGVASPGLSRPGNLVASGDWILSLNANRLIAYPQAAKHLKRVQSELAGAPGDERLRLEAAELQLALGRHEQSQRELEQLIDSRDGQVARRSRDVLRELLFLQLAATRGQAEAEGTAWLLQLTSLSGSPRQLARVLVKESQWHLDRHLPLKAIAAADRLDSLTSESHQDQVTEISADRDGTHVLDRQTWVGLLSRQATVQSLVRDNQADRALRTRLRDRANRLVLAGTLPDRIAFTSRHRRDPVADPVRLVLADQLTDLGRFQQAEMLLLATRSRERGRGLPPPAEADRLGATRRLISLWSRLGLHDECGPLLDEIGTGLMADVVDRDGVSGRDWIRALPADHLAVQLWRSHRQPTPAVSRARMQIDRSLAATAELPKTYQRFRRRFSTSERSTFDLLETYDDSTRRVTLMDRQVGIASGHINLPTQFSVPIWWHQSRSGHLLPLGSHSSMLGLSLLERHSERPLWQTSFSPLETRPEMLRVGPAGALAVTFQSRQHLMACDPSDGSLLWRRADLEPGSGSFSDASSGFFGDDLVLVLSRSDRVTHDVFETQSGSRREAVTLPITPRTRRRAFGRHLMYVTTESPGVQRLRVWDPLKNTTTIDQLLKDRIFPVATPDHELAWIDKDGRLKVHDLQQDTRLLDTQVLGPGDERMSSIKVFRDRDCWFLAMLPTQGAAAAAPGNSPVYFVGDTLLPVTHVHGHLVCLDATAHRIRWRQRVPLRSVVRFRNDHLPALVMLGRTRDRGRGGRQRMLIELLDSRTGKRLLLNESLPTDRIVLGWYDPRSLTLDLQGLTSRISIRFEVD